MRYGVKHQRSRTGREKDTCTACAGSMILEFSALSRLTGEPIFEVTLFLTIPYCRYMYLLICFVGKSIQSNGVFVEIPSPHQ
jgi:hypothetical protein